MLRYGKMPLLLLCAITSVAIAAAATLSHQDGRQPEQTGPAGKGKGRLADLPAVELESAETADAEKDAKRVAKSKNTTTHAASRSTRHTRSRAVRCVTIGSSG